MAFTEVSSFAVRHPSEADVLSGTSFGFFQIPIVGLDPAAELDKLSQSHWLALRERRAGVILDNSAEGPPFSAAEFDRLHTLLSERGAPLSAFIYVTQNESWAAEYTIWRRKNGITLKVECAIYHYFLKQFFDYLFKMGDAEMQRRRAAFSATGREKLYVALNYKPRPYRIALLTRIIRDELWDKGFISFGGMEAHDKITKSVTWSRPDPVAQFLNLSIAKESKTHLPTLLEKGEVLTDELPRAPNGIVKVAPLVLDRGSPIYPASYFSVVSDTAMYPFLCRVTEKPFKALANMHPLIMFGGVHSLRQIRGYGFRTFDGLVDEAYDAIADPNERFEAAYDQFLSLLGRAASISFDKNVHDILDHNLNHSFEGMKAVCPQMDRRLSEKLMLLQSALSDQ